jgi:hypothetical protein
MDPSNMTPNEHEDRIERVAKAICVNLGLNPDDSVPCGVGDDFTPAEWIDYRSKSDSIPMVMLYLPRWRLYRGHAATQIAARAALDAEAFSARG